MRIRAASPADYQAVVDMIGSEEELFKVYPAGRFPLTTQQVQGLAETRTDLTVLEEEGRVVGFANLYDHAPTSYVFIGNVIVNPMYRGKGFGRKLVKYMSHIAFSKYAVDSIRISVFSCNHPALFLYGSLGFKPYAMEERRDYQGRRTVLLHLEQLSGSMASQEGIPG